MDITFICKLAIACVVCMLIMWLVFPDKEGE